MACTIFSNIWKWFLSILISSLIVLYLGIMRLIKGKEFLNPKPRPVPPPIINDPKWGNHCYLKLKSQGIRLHYVEKGDSNKPLMLCLHGFPECWLSWRHQLDQLSDNYWVVAVDMRGYGDSDKPAEKSAYDITNLVEDIRQFILALDKETCILMAHDWGGVIAWRLVMKYPKLFDHHISFNGPHPLAFWKVKNSSWKQSLMSWYMIFFRMPLLPELLISSDDFGAFDRDMNGYKMAPEVAEGYKYYLSQEGALSPPIHYYRRHDMAEDPRPLRKVIVPTLIVWGTEDLALSKEMASLGAEECENAQVKFVEGAKHWVPQEKPDLVKKIVSEYLSQNQH